jgi:hypothetical protein
MTSRAVFATRQIAGLASLFDCLRHISPEVTLHVTDEGIRIGELTGTNAMYIHVTLDAIRFEKCEGASSWVMRTGTTHLILGAMLRQMGSASRYGILTMSHDPEDLPPTCIISLGSAEGASDSDMRYVLPCKSLRSDEIKEHIRDIDENELRMFSTSYERCMYVSARHLSHLVSHVFPLGDRIGISCNDERVSFSIHNSFSMITRAHVAFRTSAALSINESAAQPDTKRRKKEQDGQACFFMQSLLMMLSRAMSLHATTAILLPDKPDMPAMMEANVADLGKLSIAIAQVDAEPEDDQILSSFTGIPVPTTLTAGDV